MCQDGGGFLSNCFITVSVNLWDGGDLARRGQVRLVGRVVMSAGEENMGVGNEIGRNR